MNELVEAQLKILYPDRPKEVNFITHVKNEGDRDDLSIAPIRRLLNGAIKRKNLRGIIVGLDDSTTDNTEDILKEFKVHYFKFTWRHDFSYAKNLLLSKCEELGVKIGEWISLRGGDFSEPDEFIKRYDAFTENPDNVIGRVYVPEYSSIGIKNYLSPTLKNMFPLLHEVHRDRIIDWRYRPDIHFRHRVHENMYQDFYALTHMGNYFAKHHGIPLIGTVFHHGKNEDTLEEAQRKIFYYIVLMQFDVISAMYDITDNYKLMEEISVTSKDRLVMYSGFDNWVEWIVSKYMKGDIPKGLYKRYMETRKSYNFEPIYG